MTGGSLIDAALAATREFSAEDVQGMLREPVIILSAPRSGSNLLFERMMAMDGLWSIGGESHGIFRAFPRLRAENEQLDSGALDASHADAETCRLMRACFLTLLRDHAGVPFLRMPPERRPSSITLLEKTPRNALNIPFLLELFPDARFIHLHRDPRANVASIIEAWSLGLATGRFVTFRDLPGWDRAGWCFLLPRGWRSLIGRPLAEIAAFQWAASNDAILDGLAALPTSRRMSVAFDDLIDSPGDTLTRLRRFASGPEAPAVTVEGPLPISRTTLSAPARDKWKKYEREIEEAWPAIAATAERISA